jgi:hypothetical protein
MDRRFGRIFLFLFIASVLFIVIVFKIFGGHHKPAINPNIPVVKPLPQYSSTLAQVSFALDGPINGDDQHRAIKITIDQFQRKLDIIGGYNGNIIEEKSFDNNPAAYNVFLHSIANEGFLVKRKNPTVINETGQCPLGERFVFELNDSGTVLSHLWSTSCGGSLGTIGVSTASIQQLFRNQITGYDKIISEANVEIGF